MVLSITDYHTGKKDTYNIIYNILYIYYIIYLDYPPLGVLLSCSWAPLWLEQLPPSVTNCPLLPWADWFLSTKGCISSAHCCWLIALVTLTVWVRGTMCCAVVLKMYTLSTLTTNRMEPWGFKIEWSSTTPSYLETKLGYTHEYMHKCIYDQSYSAPLQRKPTLLCQGYCLQPENIYSLIMYGLLGYEA